MENVRLKERFMKKLSEAMQAHGWTNSELARRMGVSRQFVGQYTGGEKTPGLDVVERFANALELEDPSILIDRTEISQPVA